MESKKFRGENFRGLLGAINDVWVWPLIFHRKLLWIDPKPRNSWKFSPSKVSHYTVHYVYCSQVLYIMILLPQLLPSGTFSCQSPVCQPAVDETKTVSENLSLGKCGKKYMTLCTCYHSQRYDMPTVVYIGSSYTKRDTLELGSRLV